MELDKAINNLDNVEQIESELSALSSIDSELTLQDNIESELGIITQVEYKYKGEETDNIIITVDNIEKTIYGTLKQVQYPSVKDFPSVGSDKILYVDLSDNSLWIYLKDIGEYQNVSANVEDAMSNVIILGIDGIIEAERVVFEVQNAESFMPFRTNQRRFIMAGNLPIVGILDDSFKVAITFGDTTYNVYSFLKGADVPLTIGDLKSAMSYNIETGYYLYAEMLFLETNDIKGFVVIPSVITAEQLTKIIEDTDGIVVGLDPTGTKVNLQLNATITNRLQRALVTPMVSPSTTELVAVDDSNSQTMIEVGEGLKLENGKLSTTNADIEIPKDYVTLNTNQTINASKTIVGNLTIEGNITQNGENYITQAEKVETEDDYILMRKGATGGLGSGYSGFEVENYNGAGDNARLVVDGEGTARVGDVGDEQPLLTREETTDLADGEVLVWNATTNRAEGSSEFEKTEDVDKKLANKRDVTTNANKLYATNENGNQTEVSYGTSSTGNMIVQRGAGGQIATTDPTADVHVVNLKTMNAALEEKYQELYDLLPTVEILD